MQYRMGTDRRMGTHHRIPVEAHLGPVSPLPKPYPGLHIGLAIGLLSGPIPGLAISPLSGLYPAIQKSGYLTLK